MSRNTEIIKTRENYPLPRIAGTELGYWHSGVYPWRAQCLSQLMQY